MEELKTWSLKAYNKFEADETKEEFSVVDQDKDGLVSWSEYSKVWIASSFSFYHKIVSAKFSVELPDWAVCWSAMSFYFLTILYGCLCIVAIGKPKQQVHTMAASNNSDHTPCSLSYCLFAPHIYGYYSSRTSCSWWIAHSTQHCWKVQLAGTTTWVLSTASGKWQRVRSILWCLKWLSVGQPKVN